MTEDDPKLSWKDALGCLLTILLILAVIYFGSQFLKEYSCQTVLESPEGLSEGR